MGFNVARTPAVILGAANADGTFTGVTSGQSVAFDAAQAELLTIAVVGNGTISGGTVLIEEAMWLETQMPYSGTWSTMYTVTASGLSGGAQQLFHFPPSAYARYRVRISSNITGGGGVSALKAVE